MVVDMETNTAVHTAVITCGSCGHETLIALGMASAIMCVCKTEIVIGEDTPGGLGRAGLDLLVSVLRESFKPMIASGKVTEMDADERARNMAMALQGTFSMAVLDADPDCPRCGWDRFGCSHELSGCRRSTGNL